MVDSKYTLDGLPVISAETIVAAIDILSRLDTKKENLIDRIKEENPNLFALVTQIVRSGSPTTDYKVGFWSGTMTVYELFRRQTAANKLED